MKINPNYKMREIASETLVVNQGIVDVNMTRIISLNKSARLLYKELADKDFTAEDAAKILAQRYGIDEERAMKDAQKWVESLKECGLIENE